MSAFIRPYRQNYKQAEYKHPEITMFRSVFWDVLMMEAARTSETSVDNYFTRQYIPEDKCELHTRRRENMKSHILRSYLQ
jgi:hypothetical protein